MLSVTEAQQIVLEKASPLAAEIAPVSSTTLGLILAEEIRSDVDMPPFTKSLMDGYAVRVEDLIDGNATLRIIEEVTAGGTPLKKLETGQATRIMTGAPIPDGADAVVMVERTTVIAEGQVQIENSPLKTGQNILPQGREMKQGDMVLSPGKELGPQEFGLLASVGKTAVNVHPAPIVAILSTGDELVEPIMKPGPGQIRNSNGTMLLAQVCRANAIPKFLGIAKDNVESLTSLIREGLEANILILSGGVSAGKLDLVPGVLQDLGVTPHFHKVQMKPGKPIYFGSKGKTLVFGLPGNPVSSLVGFELFVRPAIRRMMNHSKALPEVWQSPLAEEFAYKSDRPTYHPAFLNRRQNEVTLIPWFGSPDLRGLAGANAFAIIAPGDHQFPKGQVLNVLPLDW